VTDTWDPARAATFFDGYGEREWTRPEDGRTPAASLDAHVRMLERFVQSGDTVLDAGAGPGRFTIELARIGANVVALDVSPGQLELHRARTVEAGADARVRDLRMRLLRWEELRQSLQRHGRIVAAAAAGLLPDPVDAAPELRELVRRIDLDLGGDPGVIGCGLHMLAAVEVA